jgi:hypothetical protein
VLILGPVITWFTLLWGCNRAPPAWTGPEIRLPQAEHAYAFPLRAASMVSSTALPKLEKLIEKHCKFIPEEELVEEEDIVENLPEDSFPREMMGRLYEESARGLFPEALVSPAVVVVTLEEIQWMGTAVTPLQEGAVFPAAHENMLIPQLYDALEQSVDATKEVGEICGTWWEGNVLLALDARVPLHTFYQVLYTLGQAQFDTMALIVSDPDPAATRSNAPIGGEVDSGSLLVTSEEYQWKRWKKDPIRWSHASPWPKALEESAPPRGLIDLGFNGRYGDYIAAQDTLAGRDILCVYPALQEDRTASSVPALLDLPPAATLSLDSRGTIPVHIQEVPKIGGPRWHEDDDYIAMRGDGARCALWVQGIMSSGAPSQAETKPPASLQDNLGMRGIGSTTTGWRRPGHAPPGTEMRGE